MNTPQTKYELLRKESPPYKQRSIALQICLLIVICVSSSVAVYSIWTAIYQRHLTIPPKLIDIPQSWIDRAMKYANSRSFDLINQTNRMSLRHPIADEEPIASDDDVHVIKLDNEMIFPSKLGNYIYSADQSTSAAIVSADKRKLVCYYSTPINLNHTNELYPDRIDPHICTHINVGIVWIEKNRMVFDSTLEELFRRMNELKRRNPDLKVLIWVGGAGSYGFSEMVKNHANRKEFIRSLKSALEKYRLDGIDIDWEFPSAHNRERQHFSQLLHEIRREYQREHRTYLLSVAVAAPQGIVFYAYDIGEINQYADFVNIMTYDYHFYSRGSPFTGLNAPLYKRSEEHSIFATLNINATVNYWNEHGLDKNKIIIGLPTYGHSFRLVNALNTRIGSPASGNGRVGSSGFVTYSDVCSFKRNNFFVYEKFDEESCSPYIYAGTEWISYENERSITCKTEYVKANGFGGVMIFSLNTDDYSSYCYDKPTGIDDKFPLVRKINSILFPTENQQKIAP